MKGSMNFGASLLAGLLALTGCTGADSGGASSFETPADTVSTPLLDHHIHLLSPMLVADWKSLGVPFSRPDDAYTSGRAVLESSGAERAMLISMAHFYAHAELGAALGLTDEQQMEKVRGENDWIADQGRDLGDRASVWCSVPMLRSYTRSELERCRGELGSEGIKIHFASSGVDLREPEHLRELRTVAGWAEQHGVPLLLHVDPQLRGHETSDIEKFIETVLAPHPGLEVIIAHLGGSGGYGPWTRSVFTTFSDWLGRNPERKIWFDVSAVALAKESEGVPASTEEELGMLARDLRKGGLDRILFATDYPLTDATAYSGYLRDRLPLAPAELDVILRNRFGERDGSRTER